MRWYFLFFSSFSALRSPLIESTPPSTLTRTSSLFTPGNSTLIAYSLSSSAMSTGGIHSVSVNPSSPPSFFRGSLRPKSEATLFCISSISRLGSQTEEPLSGFHFSSAFMFSFRSQQDLILFPAQNLAPADRPSATACVQKLLLSSRFRDQRVSSTHLNDK